MDRDTLLGLVARYDETTLKVDVEGMIYDESEDHYTVEDLEAALHDLETDISNMRKVVAWAKLAPQYKGSA